MNKVAFVIITWNSSATIDACLKSLGRLGIETVVVDNSSSDDTVNRVKKYPQVKLIENKSNLGFAAANNVAIKKVETDFVFLLNPDAELTGGALEKMVEFMEKNREVGILGPKLLNADGSLQKEMTPFPSLLDQVLILLRLHRLPWFRGLVYPNYNYDKIQEAEHLMGAALLIRQEVFAKIGFLDENFFLWFEETDFEKRAKDAGFKIVYFPAAVVFHIRSVSIKKIKPLARQFIWNKSLRYYFKKHRPRLEQFILEPFIILSYIPPFCSFLRRKLNNENRN